MNASRQGYPLGALFVLVTACAVLAAGVTPVVRLAVKGELDAVNLSLTTGIAAGCGLFIGLIAGVLHFRRALGAFMGMACGTMIGAAAGAISLTPQSKIATAAAAMTAGSGLVVAVALLMRRVEE